jgi:tetratricopeptide (TPR) repeat protein
MPKISGTTSERAESESLAESIRDEQIPCVLVYPDRKHVPYIYHLVNCIEELLPALGFKVSKLCDKTPPNSHFGENFEKLAEDCAFGIVILDGFRPNVLFEYGLLRGKEKVILPLQDKKACIAIRSLYSITDLADDDNIKTNTGLTRAQFNRLKEPPVGYFGQFSDRHGMNVIVVDCSAELTSPEHPKCKIKAEVNKLMPKILQKYTKQSLEPVKQKTPEHLEKFQEVTLKVLQYYTQATSFEYGHVEKAVREITELERESGVTLPSTIYGTIGSLYETLAEQASPSNTREKTKLYIKAIKLHERILRIETDSSLCASSQFSIGNAYGRLAEVRDPEANLAKAIKAFEEALSIYTKKDFPTKHAIIKRNLERTQKRLRN